MARKTLLQRAQDFLKEAKSNLSRRQANFNDQVQNVTPQTIARRRAASTTARPSDFDTKVDTLRQAAQRQAEAEAILEAMKSGKIDGTKLGAFDFYGFLRQVDPATIKKPDLGYVDTTLAAIENNAGSTSNLPIIKYVKDETAKQQLSKAVGAKGLLEEKPAYAPAGQTGEQLTIDKATNEVVGLQSGKIYGKGTSLEDALAIQNRLQSGGTADVTGAFAPKGETGTGFTPNGIKTSDIGGVTSSSILPAGFNTNGLTPDQVKIAEETFLKAQGDQTLLDKVLKLQDITEEDTQNFLNTAAKEQDPYYNQIFSRATEDFTRSLDFQKQERELQMKQEQQQFQEAKDVQTTQMAEAGLATSGIQQKAEQKLAEQAADVATSSRRRFEFDVTGFGRKTEDVLGSSMITPLKLPELGGQSIYQARGDIRGSLERERETNKQLRADELQAEETRRRQEVLASEGGVTTL